MKENKTAAGSASRSIYVVGLLAAILMVLFWRSFLPGYVHFSNDGPLGQQNAAWARMPAGMTGVWIDANYLGVNGGVGALSLTVLLQSLLSPIYLAKFYPALTLFLVGLSAWTCFRQLKLSPLAAGLGALATMLNSTFFSSACWGVGSQEIALAMDFFAVALIAGCDAKTPPLVCGIRVVLAGLCVGLNVIEAADIGALFSILVASFVFFHALAVDGGALFSLSKTVRGVTRVLVVAGAAGIIALQTVLSLVGNSIQAVAGTSQDSETKAAHWDWATQWSEPKLETLALFVPGLFGYKMDTPKDMMPSLVGLIGVQDTYRNGVYWGGVGRDPAIDRYFDAGGQGTPPGGFMRFTGGGNYCGILVLLVAGWAVAQALRRKDSAFTDLQRKMVLFFGGVMVLCLLFAWGRFAPFYALLYKLPYFSSIRNPAKFLIFLSWALTFVFAYGLHALDRRYLDPAAVTAAGWAKTGGFDRRCIFVSLGLLAASVAAWIIYGSKQADLIQYLQKVGFSDPDPTHENSAGAIAAFSLGQVGWFLVLLATAVGLLLAVLMGYFNGARAKTGALLLGGFLLFDLGRANLPWVVHWDYKQKYEVGSLNPILEMLRDKSYEHRVAGLPFEPQQQLRGWDYLFGGSGLYRIEWVQHQFPYYNIQSLDVVQLPRMPVDMKAYKEALAPRSDPASYPLIAREWMLTNTRYLLGAAGFLGVLNQELDPGQQRFKIVQRFDLDLKPGVAQLSQLEQLAAVPSNDGDLALFEFTGALPRAKVYSNWQVNTNDSANLKALGDLSFDPAMTVLVSTSEPGLPALATNDNSGSVEYQEYHPKHIVLTARTTAPSVLLLNDKFDPRWQVFVDGQPAQLLRCNFIMRGVYLPTPGQHTVEFRFSLPHPLLYVTLTAWLTGLGLGGLLVVSRLRRSAPAV